MNVKRIYIDGFKNIDNVNVVLSKITGLLSCNNFGKSNFLTAIDFALYFIKASSREKFQMMNNKNFIPILNCTFGKNYKFEIEFSTEQNDKVFDVIYGYEFQWNISSEKGAKIVNEYLKEKSQDSQKFLSLIERNDDISFYKRNLSGRCDAKVQIKNCDLLINKFLAFDHLYYKQLIETLNNIDFYVDRHFDSRNLFNINPLVTKENNYLSPLADNGIARILIRLKDECISKYNLIINTIKDLFPYIMEIEIHEIDLSGQKYKTNIGDDAPFTFAENEYVLFVKTNNISQKIPFSNMSDGVKRVFSVLTYITLADYNNIPLIAIEELENSIHPGLFKKYLITLSNFTKNSKIIITSHSPYLINFLNLSSIYIGMPNNNGIANFRKIKKSAIKKIITSAENMDMMTGEYLFDLINGYDKDDIDKLKKYLENE